MCGIAGILKSSNNRDDLRGALERVQRSLRHRGPDDQGMFVAGGDTMGLAHTRLSILDLSPAGHQPMKDPSAGNWITYNGEIYNYRELRLELEDGVQRVGGRDISNCELRNSNLEISSPEPAIRDSQSVVGHPSSVMSEWQSQTDTEVILRGYARWGRDCVHHLRGMFAFALWDENRREIFLARDPMGIKPLYYYHKDGLFLFASEVRTLLASGLVPRRLSAEGLSSYLHYGSVQDPVTIIDGVRSLLPGHSLVVGFGDGGLQVESSHYARDLFDQGANPEVANRKQAVEALRSILEESVRLHLVSDMPLGVFLSGGIDSTALVALMSQVAVEKPKTFSVVFAEKEFSEASHARLVARQFATEHHEIPLTEERLLKLLPEALKAMDQPTMDGINTFVISKAVKEAGVTVALSGLGGDELFGGYPSFRRARQLQTVTRAPHGVRKAASAAGRALFNGSVGRRKFWDAVGSDCTPRAAYEISRELFAPDEAAVFINGVRGQRSDDRNSQFSILNSQFSNTDPVNAVSVYELSGYMVNTLLRDTDCMSMAHALEVRVPFIDPVVVQYVLGLPGAWKMDNRRPKPLLLDAVEDCLPQEIWRRPKKGFTLPFERWMHSSLRPGLDEALSSHGGLAQIGIDPEFVRTLWQAFKSSPRKERWSRPWALYALLKWCEINNVS